jgi:hypothetical protein
MQAYYESAFEREQGSTEAEWLQRLPGAAGECAVMPDGPGRAVVAIGPGCLQLAWEVMPPRQIALIRMPRLRVQYRFVSVADDDRQRFMKRFDLYIQRGGG